jgi:hypothetical protein
VSSHASSGCACGVVAWKSAGLWTSSNVVPYSQIITPKWPNYCPRAPRPPSNGPRFLQFLWARWWRARDCRQLSPPPSAIRHGALQVHPWRCVRNKWLCPPGKWPPKKMYCRDHGPPGSLNIAAAWRQGETSEFATRPSSCRDRRRRMRRRMRRLCRLLTCSDECTDSHRISPTA